MSELTSKYGDSPRTFDIKAICNNPDLGSLKFTEVEEILEEMVRIVIELEDFDYEVNLKNVGSRKKINNAKKDLNELLRRIQSFDIKQPNNENLQKEIITQIRRFFDDRFYDYIESPLATLRYEKFSNLIDVDKITEGREKLEKIILETEKEKENLQNQLSEIKKEKTDLQSGKLSLGTSGLAKDFDDQYINHYENAKIWLGISIGFYVVIVCFILIKLFFNNWSSIDLKQPVIYIEFILDLVLISSVFYGLSFVRKNYNIERNLELRNRNRRTLAATLDRFLMSGVDIDFKKDMIAKAAPAIFSLDKSGYLDRDENNLNPTHEVISNIIKPNLK